MQTPAPSQAGHIPSAALHPGSRFSYHDPGPLRGGGGGGTVYIWDIFVRHQCSKSFSVKLLIAFGSLNQKRALGTFSRGWLRWLLPFKRSSEVQDGDSQGHTSVLPDPSHCLQTALCAK